MRPFWSTEVETIGISQWWGQLPRTVWLGARHATGLVGYKFGKHGDSLPHPFPETPPQTPLTEAADRAAASSRTFPGLDASFRKHSLRTWYFAAALAMRDRKAELDGELLELLYVAAMLHDTGLFMPDRTECFAMAGSQLAQSSLLDAGATPRQAKDVAVAIAGHIDLKPPTILSRYLQAGSLLDVAGTGVWRVDPDVLSRVCTDFPRDGFPNDARRVWLDECGRFPHGRAAYARFPGLLPRAIKWCPLPD